MRILHYSLGFPPYRSGGLTKFSIDLMRQQFKDGHDVALMWPGQMRFCLDKTQVKYRGYKEIDGSRIRSYEVINPLPVSYDEGIKDFSYFVSEGNRKDFDELLNSYGPDVVHIHTLMGLHKAFMDAVKQRGIRLVFTAHDFFPLCPKVTMFRNGEPCSSADSCEECGICNSTSLDISKIKILQSPLYRLLKDSPVVKKMRKRHRDEFLEERADSAAVIPVGTPEEYKELRAYYIDMLRDMDIIHYNSELTKNVYDWFIDDIPSCIIGISHFDIKDNRRIKAYSEGTLRIRYLGPYSESKGFFYLKRALDRLWESNHKFCLDVHFEPQISAPYIQTHNRYSYSELEHIFEETDICIIPSILYETFGYTLLEALSYGVPVITTKNVGAKDIIASGCGVVIEDTHGDELYEVLKSLSKQTLERMNQCIVENQKIITLKDMACEIQEKCYRT